MRNARKITLILVVVVMVIGTMAMGALSYFSDTETSAGNTFTAARLDMTIDGQNGVNVQKFNIERFSPGSQPKKSWTIANIGDIKGYFGISSVIVQNLENALTEPEEEAGDVTADIGELGDLVNIRLFIDYGKDGWVSTGDKTIYNGKISNLPSSFDLDEEISAGGDIAIVALFDWWNNGDLDNTAQSDTCNIDFTFRLTQRTDQ